MQRDIEYKTDSDNQEFVLVPVGHGKAATVDKSDFDMLLNMGVPMSWMLVRGNYVTASDWDPVRKKAIFINIGRLIMDANSGEIVRYKDRDTLNLRRNNLIIQQYGWGKSNARDQILPTCPTCKQKLGKGVVIREEAKQDA